MAPSSGCPKPKHSMGRERRAWPWRCRPALTHTHAGEPQPLRGSSPTRHLCRLRWAGWDRALAGCRLPWGAALGTASPGWWLQGPGCAEGAAVAMPAPPASVLGPSRVPRGGAFPGQGGHPWAEGPAGVWGQGWLGTICKPSPRGRSSPGCLWRRVSPSAWSHPHPIREGFSESTGKLPNSKLHVLPRSASLPPSPRGLSQMPDVLLLAPALAQPCRWGWEGKYLVFPLKTAD